MSTKFKLMFFFLSLCLFPPKCAFAGSIDELYEKQEEICVQKGWQKVSVDAGGKARKFLWKGPQGVWKNGAIIVLHGGGGSFTNWCGDMRAPKPMAEFSDVANMNGFAVFALDSSDRDFKDAAGNSCGKRFDFTARQDYANIDLPFFEAVITKHIQRLRPVDSATDIFIAGISNGGFMALRAATHFDDKISAFALVSAGDSYGSYIKCQKELTPREGAPGLFYDNETDKNIGESDSCLADSFLHEKEWDTAHPLEKPAFKQFHHEGDAGVDMSCMKKAELLLKGHGYRGDTPYIIRDREGKKKLWKHFWQQQYNQPLIDFFLRNKKKAS